MKKIGNLVLLLFLFVASTSLAQIVVQAELLSDKIGVGQSVNLELRVRSKSDVKIDETVPPPFDGFRAQGPHKSTQVSTRMQSGPNGMEYNSQQIVTFTYKLQAVSPGQKVIKPFSVVVDGKEFKTESIPINVAAKPVHQPHADPMEALFGDEDDPFAQMHKMEEELFNQVMRGRGVPLAFRADASVTDIAYVSGYEHAESFSRAFRRVLGQSPSAFRERPDWDAWLDLVEPLHRIRSQHMHTPPELADVRILTLPDTRIALLDHVGPQERLGDRIRRFIGWRRANRLPPAISATYNVVYDDPDDTSPAEFRFGLAAATDRDIAANAEGVVAGTIPGGRCAVLRHVGSEATLGPALRFLFAEWLPQCGETPRDFPPYLQRIAFFPDVPEHQAATDLFLPMQPRP